MSLYDLMSDAVDDHPLNLGALAVGAEIRQLRLLIWAAKCHVHQRTTKAYLGALPHTESEVQAAIDAFDVPPLKLDPCSDEGIKSTSAGLDRRNAERIEKRTIRNIRNG